MIADLDLSSERPEEHPSQHEEGVQVFNNDLFQPNSHHEIPMDQPADFHDPSSIHHDSRKNTPREEADNFKWFENELAQKDTLDLNYQSEIREQHNFEVIGSSQPTGRLEDLLRDADFALRRSNDLATRISIESNKTPISNQFKTTLQDNPKTTSSYSSAKYANIFRQGYTDDNAEPQENNFVQNHHDNVYTDVFQQDQPAETFKSNKSPESKPLSNSYIGKVNVALNLFPIQEDAEQGHETPRESQKSTQQFEQVPVQVETQTYNFSQPNNLADTVLNHPDFQAGVGTTGSALGLGGQYGSNNNNDYKVQSYTTTTTTTTIPNPVAVGQREGLQSKTIIRDEGLRHSHDSTGFDAQIKTPSINSYQEIRTTYTTTSYPTYTTENIDRKIDDILKKHFNGTENRLSSTSNSNLRHSNPNIKPVSTYKYSTASGANNYQSPFSSEYTSPAQANSALIHRDYSLTSSNLQNEQLKSSGYIPNADHNHHIMLTSPGNAPLVNLASPTSSVISKERRSEFDSYQRPAASSVFEAKSKDLRISHDLFARPAESTTLKNSSTNFATDQNTAAPHYNPMYASEIIPRNYWSETPTSNEAFKKSAIITSGNKFTSPLVQKYCNPFFQPSNLNTVQSQSMSSPPKTDMKSMKHSQELGYSPRDDKIYSKVEVFQELVPEPKQTHTEYDYYPEQAAALASYRSQGSQKTDKEIIYSNIESAEPKHIHSIASPKIVSEVSSQKMSPKSGTPGVKDFEYQYDHHHHQGPSPQNLVFKAQGLQDDFTSPKMMASPQEINLSYQMKYNLESAAKNDYIDFDEPFDEEDFPVNKSPGGQGRLSGSHGYNRSPENLEEELERANHQFEIHDSDKKIGHSPIDWKNEEHVDFDATPEKNYENNVTVERRLSELPPHDPSLSGHEATPDRKMKKLTLKNRNSEERTHEKRNSEAPEEAFEERADKNSIRSVPETKHRHKIFENKVFEPEKQLQEEVFNSQRILQEMEREQNEKHKKIIFGEMPQRKGKDLEFLIDSDISPINAGERTAKTDGNYSTRVNTDRLNQDQAAKHQFDLKINKGSEENIADSVGRLNSERFPYQLKNGVLDPTESFFDFENEHFVTTDTSMRRTVHKSSAPSSIPSLEVKTQVFQEPPETTMPSKRRLKKKEFYGSIWIIEEPAASQHGQNILRPQTFKEHIKKVPVITHCFRKFHETYKNFPIEN